ncbi:hypothetical protein jhhlp_002822 [Lomentospora prolificans]|uniref:Uncharacterized protein n=1 Tax=Lomentospora prolificans TaxID=41688 RepID=A0A2N3NF80_9PEZI|nr:hypothetical protein jhhlp_002822 [Lomentospora prolificans]
MNPFQRKKKPGSDGDGTTASTETGPARRLWHRIRRHNAKMISSAESSPSKTSDQGSLNDAKPQIALGIQPGKQDDIVQEESEDMVHPNQEAVPQLDESLWDRAYEKLRDEGDLIGRYEKFLTKLFDDPKWCTLRQDVVYPVSPSSNGFDIGTPEIYQSNDRLGRRKQMVKVAETGLKHLEDKEITYRIAGREYALHDQVTGAVKIVNWAKGFIGEAVKDAPQASLAWAAVSLVLPLLINPSTEDTAQSEGYTYIVSRMRYYACLEPLLLSDDEGSIPATMKPALEESICKLYGLILSFQIQSVFRFYRHRIGTFFRDMVKFDDWESLVQDIKDCEGEIQKDCQQINSASAVIKLADISRTAADTFKKLTGYAEELLSTAQEHRDISAQHLTVAQEQLDIAKRVSTAEQEKCLQLLRLSDYGWYKDRVTDRLPNTCNWFLDHPNYRTWREATSGPLLVSADPGCGKTVLARYLIEHELPADATICYFFFKAEDQNTVKQALCGLLHQLFSKRPELISYLMEGYNKNGKGLIDTVTVLWSILESATRDPDAGTIIYVIDALDECQDAELRTLTRMIKDHFKVQSSQDQRKLKMILTSRPYEDVTFGIHSLVEYFPFIRIHGEDEWAAIGTEINVVIKNRVREFAKQRGLRDSLREHLQSRLLGVEHRTYLWVYLVFDYLEETGFKKTSKGIDESIATMPQTVNDAYEKILSRSKDKVMVRKALSLVLGSGRPLTLSEMRDAMAVTPEVRTINELDLEDEDDFRIRLRDWCGLFLTVYNGKVEFLHQSAREFLLAKPGPPEQMRGLSWSHSFPLREAHSVLAEVCIVFLALDGDLIGDVRVTLFKYAALYWAMHVRESGPVASHLQQRYQVLCEPKQSKCQRWLVFWQMKQHHRKLLDTDFLPSIALRAILGHLSEVKAAVAEGASVHALVDARGLTMLWVAWENHHFDVVEYLLQMGADPNQSPAYRNIAWQGFADGNVAAPHLMPLLLERGLDPGLPQPILGGTLLHEVQDLTTARLLIDAGANVNAGNYFGDKPLHRHKSLDMVKLLLEAGADPTLTDFNGKTPLHQPHTSPEVVEELIRAGCPVNRRDIWGRAPIYYSLDRSVQEALLRHGAAADDRKVEQAWQEPKGPIEVFSRMWKVL